jgi:hypothetical protein
MEARCSVDSSTCRMRPRRCDCSTSPVCAAPQKVSLSAVAHGVHHAVLQTDRGNEHEVCRYSLLAWT